MQTRYFLASLLAALTLSGGCARREKPAKAPVVETVRTPESPTPPMPPAAARDLADVMASTLRLSSEQTVKIRAIFSGTVEQVNAARQKFPARSAALNAELRRINTASETQLRTTLGAASYQEFQSKKRQIQAQMQQRAVK